jgi:hypothetical protein
VIKVDRVGVEANTSARVFLRAHYSFLYPKSRSFGRDENTTVQLPPAPPFLCKSTNIDHQPRFKKASQGSNKNKTTMAGFGIICLAKREIEKV